MKPIANHKHETDDEVIKRHMHRELQTWIGHLEALNSEAEQLSQIASNIIGDQAMRHTLLDNINAIRNLVNEFYTYRNQLNNVRECDDMECDQFYRYQHDQVYEHYMDCVSQYRTTKDSVYQKLLKLE